MTPVSSCSTSGGTRCELPRPKKPKFIGQASAACSIFPVLNGPPESIPTVIGPSEPPIIVVIPLARACLTRQARVDAVHDGRIAGLADAHDTAMANAEAPLDDTDNGIYHDNVAQQEIQR